MSFLQIINSERSLCSVSFTQIANMLMNKHVLQVGRTYYRITDCEFYYHAQSHKDIYTHGHERQKTSIGEWYFHGSGLDITLGGNDCYGGILLTAIAEIN